MNYSSSIIALIGIFSGAFGFNSEVEKPRIQVESYVFEDSTKVELFSVTPESKIMVEFGSGNEVFYREYSGPFYVSETNTIRFRAAHPELGESEISAVRVFKKSPLELRLLNEAALLTDGKKGDYNLNSEEWKKYNLHRLEFKFKTEAKKLEEVEILSFVSPEKKILPPKKVILYAHLKNGKRVHIRTASTIGKFDNDEQFWSHTLRLNGKPKLKKILRKTLFFSLTVIPHQKDGETQTLCFDEILVR